MSDNEKPKLYTFIDCTPEETFKNVSNVSNHKHFFNNKCGIIMGLVQYDTFDGVYFLGEDFYCRVDKYNPYDSLEQLSCVVEKLMFEHTIHGGVVDFKFKNRPNAILEDWRDYVNSAIILSKEEIFNKMCIHIIEKYDIPNCSPYEQGFNPFDYIQDLAPVTSFIIKKIDKQLPIPTISGNYDMHACMLEYVMEYGQGMLDA